jgi:hypothetical protein
MAATPEGGVDASIPPRPAPSIQGDRLPDAPADVDLDEPIPEEALS